MTDRTPHFTAAVATTMFAALLFSSPRAYADDTVACIAASEKALSEVTGQKLLDARASLAVCAAAGCPDIVRASCQRRFGEVNQAIPAVVFETKDGAGNDLSSVALTVDGKPLVEHPEGAPVVLDPGKHLFHFEATGHPAFEKEFVLRQGERDRHERIVFADLVTEKHAELPTEHRAAAFWTPPRMAGVAVGAVGVAGIVVGSAFGLMVPGDKKDAACESNGVCFAGPLHTANVHATVATVGFVAGGALIAGGAALVLFAPKGEAGSVQVAPAVSLNGGGLVAGGAF